MENTFKIGDFIYEFKQGEAINADLKARNLWGEVDYGCQSIIVRDDIPQQRQGQVLMHEIAHAILHEIGHPSYNDENLINALGISLYQLLRDNDFSCFIGSEKKEAASARTAKEMTLKEVSPGMTNPEDHWKRSNLLH
jgi:hypothetical protein